MIGSVGLIGFGIMSLVELTFTTSIIGSNDVLYTSALTVIIGILTFVFTPVGLYSIVLDDSKMMTLMVCCGVHSAEMWIDSKWFSSQDRYPRRRFPESCCASCARMHERYCSAFFLSEPSENEKLTTEQKICLRASEKCSSADETKANLEVCLGNSLDFVIPSVAFLF
ncbi:unnamed protein product [Caenorhabditis auriculariae]|uniref:Uncharacterized protein n=1 Tax=Caenorhabditis auriculariae TaxID=2777116 RepID=A0A8S1GXE1_9PELO|nr:unnamed protein product [Caenorhabditis auriculariae]